MQAIFCNGRWRPFSHATWWCQQTRQNLSYRTWKTRNPFLPENGSGTENMDWKFENSNSLWQYLLTFFTWSGSEKNNIPRPALAGGTYFSTDNKGCQLAIQTVSPDHPVFDVLRPEFQTDRIAGQCHYRRHGYELPPAAPYHRRMVSNYRSVMVSEQRLLCVTDYCALALNDRIRHRSTIP